MFSCVQNLAICTQQNEIHFMRHGGISSLTFLYVELLGLLVDADMWLQSAFRQAGLHGYQLRSRLLMDVSAG